MSDKPNVLIIWGDDIGQSNLSCYTNGLMGYRTSNIDRLAAEGVLFTDYYASRAAPPDGPHSSPPRIRIAPG